MSDCIDEEVNPEMTDYIPQTCLKVVVWFQGVDIGYKGSGLFMNPSVKKNLNSHEVVLTLNKMDYWRDIRKLHANKGDSLTASDPPYVSCLPMLGRVSWPHHHRSRSQTTEP